RCCCFSPRVFSMITPAFELSQDPDFLTITIRVPYARVSEFDVYFEGMEFKFYAKPYFLRLVLPGRIVEDGREKATYDDSDKNIGRNFLAGRLVIFLIPIFADPLISGAENDDNIEEEEEFDWEIEQTLCESKENSLCSLCTYGFGNQKSGVFKRLQFSADFFEDEAICQLLKYKPWWTEVYRVKMASQEGSPWNECNQTALVDFTEDEKEQLRKFTNRTFLLDKRTCHQVYLSLVDILLAYCYEIYATEGERNVESPWNIRKLSSTLCWLETFTGISEVLIAFGRRVLCYPLYRHFSLATRALNDTIMILQLA
ncbi:hypothetical protein JD844_013041, partial [Phrynosoma platyrhinos]